MTNRHNHQKSKKKLTFWEFPHIIVLTGPPAPLGPVLGLMCPREDIFWSENMGIKPPTTYDEQLSILEHRGIEICDTEQCKQILSSVNYYRLSAYLLPFKIDNNTYAPGISFCRIYRIYEFDRKLRRILFSAIEEIEVFLRAQFSYFHAHHYGATGYLTPSNFDMKHDAAKFQEQINREITNNKNVLFVKHHLTEYNGVFPIWVATELFTFGMLSKFYADLKIADRKYLAKALYSTTEKNLRSWLRCCTDIRNICAHYGRLYYRIFSAIPAGFNLTDREKRRLWGAMLTLKATFPQNDKWNTEVLPTLEALVDEYSADIERYHMAFPSDWAAQLRK